jgi:hypothetical protein
MKSGGGNPNPTAHLMNLSQGSNVIAEYIWIDGAQFMR